MAEALSARIAARIAAEGPMPLDAFWRIAMTDPEHGYYAAGQPIGDAGDFVTAPEISQIFGELIGLWLADAWQGQGAPDGFDLVELGPGRGQLMADTLRAARMAPGFTEAMRLILADASAPLRRAQAKALANHAPRWTTTWRDALEGDGPLFLIANEFLDALPIRQWRKTAEGWREQLIAADAEGFRFAPGPVAGFPNRLADDAPEHAPEGAVLEWSAERDECIAAIAAAVAARGGAALIIDYGHAATRLGDSLQALRNGRPADPLADPGDADLTSHVDFAAVAAIAKRAGAKAYGPVDQGTFLLRLGAEARAASLSARATPEQAAGIHHAVRRLIHPLQMGSLFKAIAIAPPDAPPPAGLTP